MRATIRTKGRGGLIVSAVLVLGALFLCYCALVPGRAIAGPPADPIVEGLQLRGADPRPFDTAEKLYSYEAKTKLGEGDNKALSAQLDSYLASQTLPEKTLFRETLLRLDGAADLGAIAGKIEKAARDYKKVLAESGAAPDPSAHAEFMEGNAAYLSGDLTSAVTSYVAALEIDPDFVDARNNLGLSDLHLGNHVAAIMQFHLILAALPNYHGAEQNLSVALERMGLSKEAFDHAKKVVAHASSLPMAQYNLGWFQNREKMYGDAAGSYEKALMYFQDYPLALRAAALNKIEGGNVPSAREMGALTAAEVKQITIDEAKRVLVGGKRVKPVSAQVASQGKVAGWWWWAAIGGLVLLFSLSVRASGNDRNGALAWGFLVTLGLVIALIVFAIFSRRPGTFHTTISIILWANVLLMIPGSARR